MTGAVLGWIVLGQSLSPVQLVGFAVTIGAIAYGAALRRQAGSRHIAQIGGPPGAANSPVTTKPTRS